MLPFLAGLAVGFPLGVIALFLWAVVDCARSRNLAPYDPEAEFQALRTRLRQKGHNR
jgi:hypothetical protein